MTHTETDSAPSAGFTAVADTADIPPGGMKCIALDRERVLLANVGGTLFAVSDICGHRNAPLSRGRLTGYTVECPLHFAQFDVRDGHLVDGPVSAPVRTYEVRLAGTTILLRR